MVGFSGGFRALSAFCYVVFLPVTWTFCEVNYSTFSVHCRLGGGEEDVREIMRHPFFAGINWQDLVEKKVRSCSVEFHCTIMLSSEIEN